MIAAHQPPIHSDSPDQQHVDNEVPEARADANMAAASLSPPVEEDTYLDEATIQATTITAEPSTKTGESPVSQGTPSMDGIVPAMDDMALVSEPGSSERSPETREPDVPRETEIVRPAVSDKSNKPALLSAASSEAWSDKDGSGMDNSGYTRSNTFSPPSRAAATPVPSSSSSTKATPSTPSPGSVASPSRAGRARPPITPLRVKPAYAGSDGFFTQVFKHQNRRASAPSLIIQRLPQPKMPHSQSEPGLHGQQDSQSPSGSASVRHDAQDVSQAPVARTPAPFASPTRVRRISVDTPEEQVPGAPMAPETTPGESVAASPMPVTPDPVDVAESEKAEEKACGSVDVCVMTLT